MPTLLLTGKGEFLYSPKPFSGIKLSELQISDYVNPLSYLKPKKKEVQVYFNVLWTEDCCRWTTIRDFLNSFINLLAPLRIIIFQEIRVRDCNYWSAWKLRLRTDDKYPRLFKKWNSFFLDQKRKLELVRENKSILYLE